ncbi:unnamed protein product [Caenorhabditis auriculariae]|uniref:Innexin n=1 Tax=Caenorhabditis auriculariae TaxID=2777116 RepID=A0A8S1H807_9PELO|nr:unnamed protein product [Caenorhabditis auriculariae]
MARYLSPREDDDWSDRLNYLVTPNILLAFSVLISFKQFGGRPIECMFPNKFPGSWEQYAENYCWSQDTYFVEPTQHVELLKAESRYTPERALSYYQWVPFFLLLQAAFFRAPSYLWKYVSNHSGIRIHEVVKKAKDTGNVEEEVKARNIDILVTVHKTIKCLNCQFSPKFISAMYLLTKGIYFANVILQLYLMNYFLRTNRYRWYGFDVVRDILSGVQWERSGYFPRAAVCDFEVRQVANIQKYSVQCVLVINIFNETIFVLLWFWYLILLLATAASFIQWFILIAFPCFSRWFISQHLELSALNNYVPESAKSSRELTKFVDHYLHRDGVFVLRMVSGHAGVIFATDLVYALWKAYYGIEEKNVDSDTESPTTDVPKSILTTSIRNRKKPKNGATYMRGTEFTTALLPEKEREENRYDSSSDSSDPKGNTNPVASV